MIYYLHSPKKSTTVDVGESTRWSRWAKKKKAVPLGLVQLI